jgi:murein L,D-transpeptidase YcbB/YkuD
VETSEAVIEALKIIISWPVAVTVIFLLLRKDVPAVLEKLAQRLKSAQIAGQTVEFFEDLEKQSKVTEAIESIQKENPELVRKSLENAGIDEKDYNAYRSKIRTTVRQVQRSLGELGYDLGTSGTDGVPGPNTKRAVMRFQADHDLMPDGVLGPQTIEAINAALTRTSQSSS